MKPSKAGDFFLGCFGVYLAGALIAALMTAARLDAGVMPVIVVAAIGSCIFAVTRQRPYIVLGIAMSVVIPILAFGACMLLFSGSYH